MENGGDERTCTRCGRPHRRKHSWCKECAAAWRAARSPDRQHERYAISAEALAALREQANGRCQICGQEARLEIDHDHDSGQVRGLLCGSCNTGLGRFRDNVDLLVAAVRYLSAWG